MNSGTYLVILAIGIIIVVAMGQLLMRKAPAYLNEVYVDLPQSRKVASLVIGLFHLVMLGVVFLVSSFGLARDAGVQEVLARVGVMLLLTALGYGITLLVLSWLREQEQGTQLDMEAGRERDRREHEH